MGMVDYAAIWVDYCCTANNYFQDVYCFQCTDGSNTSNNNGQMVIIVSIVVLINIVATLLQ